MRINNLLNFFVPKDAKFLPLLAESARELEEASELLQELFLKRDDMERKEICRLIKTKETKGDKITESIFKALNETFITPFDREDIGALADALDDALDAVHRSADKVLLYSPKELPECTIRLSEICNKAAKETGCAILELPRVKRTDHQLKINCKEIKRLEEEADDIYEKGIMTLFECEKNAVELIKLKEIIQELEKSINKMNSTGKILKTIIVKYA